MTIKEAIKIFGQRDGIKLYKLLNSKCQTICSLILEKFKLTTGAANGSVLVSDAEGNGTWQPLSNILPKTDDITVDFTNGVLTYTMYSPYNMSISSVTNIYGSPITTITKNTSPYILGTSIALGDTLVITVSVSSVIRLNIFKI